MSSGGLGLGRAITKIHVALLLVSTPPSSSFSMSAPLATLVAPWKTSLPSQSPVASALGKLSTTALMAVPSESSSSSTSSNEAAVSSKRILSPRASSIIFSALAMGFHFGGYEFIRNSCLALFTSNEFGFSSPAAFPLANGLVSPFSVILLWGYSQQLDAYGPRVALRNTTIFSIALIALVAALLASFHHMAVPKIVSQCLVGLIFLFQSSYQYLIYTQQWSFVSSVMTPDEGSRWFASIAGFSSIMCTITGSLVPLIVPYTKLLGLLATTCLTLVATLLCQERAYGLAQKHGFDPAATQQNKEKSVKEEAESGEKDDSSRFTKARQLFRRVPTLNALFMEVIFFQCLNSILGIAFVGALKQNIPDDIARSAYTGRFYSLINAVSATIQFLILPMMMNKTEPKWIWRCMPLIPVAVCLLQETRTTYSLGLVATAFFLAKTMDYSIRTVVYPMVYQPLDFESRYVGKEIIGVFGSRFGKSGMSLLLSLLTSVLGKDAFGFRQLIHLSVVASTGWLSSTWWLSSLLLTKDEAQATVQERQSREKGGIQPDTDKKKDK